ncbi:hypothetical protein OG819_49550 [Streptomyces sp. NBC_01549]|nr:hypothetical protein [Streptomyces sp. NBC_01549]MCX4597349.1 hypothetical protein [Streptomyces sp. NBC_01549]
MRLSRWVNWCVVWCAPRTTMRTGQRECAAWSAPGWELWNFT